jgi:hypothetical protein
MSNIPWEGYASSFIEVAWHGAIYRVTPHSRPGRAVPSPITLPLSVISAYNPSSMRRSAAANRAATRRLHRHLVATGIPFTAAVGYSECLEWVEPSFGLVDVEPSRARSICSIYGQAAYFELAADRLRIVDVRGVAYSTVEPSIERVPTGRSVLSAVDDWSVG